MATREIRTAGTTNRRIEQTPVLIASRLNNMDATSTGEIPMPPSVHLRTAIQVPRSARSIRRLPRLRDQSNFQYDIRKSQPGPFLQPQLRSEYVHDHPPTIHRQFRRDSV